VIVPRQLAKPSQSQLLVPFTFVLPRPSTAPASLGTRPLVPDHRLVAMAGRVRQPIDEKSFEKYLIDNVPAVKTPIELKQVCAQQHSYSDLAVALMATYSAL
jgi:hypothetical protein